MNLTPEMQLLMARARERMAEQDAHDVKQRAAHFMIDGRHAEFCGAFREILDMLVCELERNQDDPPEYEGDAEAQRIADVFADARAEQDRGL